MFKKIILYVLILFFGCNSYVAYSYSLLLTGIDESKFTNSDTNCYPWAKTIVDSEIQKGERSWAIHLSPNSHWGYMEGFMYLAILKTWKHTNDTTYLNLVERYGDYMINDNGSIKTYKKETYYIDNINAGKILFELYTQTGKQKYKLALDTLRNQMHTHPRTSEGGYWHKLKYPNQMWLDGIYMASPFLAQYAAECNEPQLFDDVVNQILLISKYTYDSTAQLYYHGWDESKEQIWANEKTGRSTSFWGRGIGWYAMAMVDVLDYLPEDHPGRQDIFINIQQLAEGIKNHRDKKTGLWYQVVDQQGREGNYMESSASAMFTYFLFKAARKGYIDSSYIQIACKGYHGIVTELLRKNEDSTWSLTNSCAVAGLGGNNRDGSYEYYISERITDSDPKAYAAFIMASIEHEMLCEKIKKPCVFK